MTAQLHRRCGIASDLAYKSEEEVQQSARAMGLACERITVDHLSVTLLNGKDTLMVAFRGTVGWADVLLTDIDMYPTRRAYGRVHRGFTCATEMIWPELSGKLAQAVRCGKKLVFTGHSLGGAMAVIAALKTVTEFAPKDIDLVTFGQPPLASPRTKRSLQAAGLNDFTRYVSSVDIFPLGPGMWFFHSGRLTYIDAQGAVDLTVQGARYWLRYLADAARFGWRLRIGAQGSQHRMSSYLTFLESLGHADAGLGAR
jgi:hypothetical protein